MTNPDITNTTIPVQNEISQVPVATNDISSQEIKPSKRGNLLLIIIPLLATAMIIAAITIFLTYNNQNKIQETKEEVKTETVKGTDETETEKQAPAQVQETSKDNEIEEDQFLKTTDKELNTSDGSLKDIKESLQDYNIDQIDLEIQSSQF